MTAKPALPHAPAPRDWSFLDPGIRLYVEILDRHGIETYESCQGGPGHSYPEPTVAFHGTPSDGFKALAVAMTFGLPVAELQRVWSIQYGEAVGPDWKLTFKYPADEHDARVRRHEDYALAQMGKARFP